jgi:hypothetical protein
MRRRAQRAGHRERGSTKPLQFKYGGDEGDRTPDLCNAIAALSQLSYVPADPSRLRMQNAERECTNLAKIDTLVKELPHFRKPRRFPRNSYRPLKTGLRFSRNAETPSCLSSVEKQIAKRSTSRLSPSSRLLREANFTASFES